MLGPFYCFWNVTELILASLLALASHAWEAAPQTSPPPPTPAAQPLRAEDARVLAIATRIAQAARPWCAIRAPTPGWVLHHLSEYAPGLRDDLVAVYQLDRGAGVVAIAEGSAAAAAGLEPGDTITHVNARSLQPLEAAKGRRSGATRDIATQVEAAIEAELAKGPARLAVLRGGAPLTLTLDAPRLCPARVRMVTSERRNAFSDGRYAIFSSRLVRDTPRDDVLAALVAHELAHNFLGHDAEQRQRSDRPRKRDQEAEADAFALRLMVAAGYDPRAALDFWRGMLGFNPIQLIGLGSHHPKGKRLDAIRDELAAIEASPGRVEWEGVAIDLPARR